VPKKCPERKEVYFKRGKKFDLLWHAASQLGKSDRKSKRRLLKEVIV
jgi:hypothetical protein